MKKLEVKKSLFAPWQSVNRAAYALGAYTDSCDLNLLKMYFHLVKLMEAAHIIDVREVTHVDGYLKAGLQETGDVG